MPSAAPTAIVGLYAVPADACSLVASLGFTVVHSYDFESDRAPDPAAWAALARPYLDRAAQHGLKVLLGVPRNWLREKQEVPVRAAVRALRDHPALLAWYEDEIAQGGDLEAVRFYVGIVETEDPDHGVILEEGKDLPALRAWGKVRMFTYYPVTQKARAEGRLKTLSERFPVGNLTKPFWPVLQAYGRDLVRDHPQVDLVAPTPDELHFTFCSALARGARGVFLYTYMHSTVYDTQRAAAKKWPYIEAKPLPRVAPALWKAAVETAAAAREVLPRLALAAPAGPEAVLPMTGAEGLDHEQWATPDGVLVVLANARSKGRAVTLQVPAGRTARRLNGGGWEGLEADASGRVRVVLAGPGGACVFVPAAGR